MIIVRRAQKALGPTEVETFRIPPARDLTVGQVLQAHYDQRWPAGTQISATLNGRDLRRDDLEAPARDGCCITLAPHVGVLFGVDVAVIALTALISTAIGFALSYVFTLFGTHKAKTPQRGDQESPTYSFDGVHTTSGAGFRIPVSFGELKVGGNVVSSNLRTDGENEYLEQVVILNDGRIESIGGITGGVRGEADGLGSLRNTSPVDIPENLTVNGNLLSSTEAEISLRMGEDLQTPMPGFDSVSTITDVEGPLDDKDQVAQAADLDDTAASFAVRLSFPGGLYELQPNGAAVAYPVDFLINWTSPTASSNAISRRVDDVRRGAFTKVLEMSEIPFVGTGPFTITVRRQTDAGDPNRIVSSCVFSKAITHRSERLAYAGRAALAIRLRGSEKVVQGQPQYGIVGKQTRVRAWDETLGFTPYGYEVPTGAFAGIWTYPIGNNPSWCLLHLLTCPQAPKPKSMSQIDLASFRDWADFCDVSADGPDGPEAAFRIDISFDSGEKYGDAIKRCLTAGRATLVRWGNRISVRYSYRDAHGRGTNSVPPRGGETFDQPDAVIDTGAMDPGSFKLRPVDRRARPNVLHFAILNRELGYEPDDIPVEDEEALQDQALALLPNTPLRKKLDYRGVVRPSQARRDGIFLHRIGRLVGYTCEFTTGLQGLPLWPGLILGVENDAARYNLGEAHHGWRTDTEQLAPAPIVTLDHDVEISASPQWCAYVAKPTGEVQYVTLTAGTYFAGDPILCSEAVTFQRGVSITVGHVNKTLRLFEIVAAGLTSDWRRKIQAIEWQPDAYEPAEAELQAFDGGDTASAWDVPAEEDLEAVGAVAFRAAQGPEQLVAIGRPPDLRTRRARVFTKDRDGWRLLTETLADAVTIPGLRPGRPQEVAVAIQDASGQYPSPQAASRFVVVAPEFGAGATPPVQSLTATATGRGLLLQWAAMDAADFLHFEVRRGPSWLGGEVVGRPSTPFLYVEDVPISSGCTYQVCARFRGGLYSGVPAQVTPSFPGLSHRLTVANLEVADGSTGTYDGVEWVDGKLQLEAGRVRGSFTSDALDAQVLAHLYWNVALESEELEDWTLDDWEGVPWSDLRWWRLNGREASSARPGVDFDLSLDEWSGGSMATLAGAPGTVGSHTRARLEIRWSDDEGLSWSDWIAYAATWRYSRTCQVRVTLDRRSVRYQRKVSLLKVTVQA